MQIYHPPPPTDATENFHKSAHIWENIVFSAHKNENLSFSKYIRANLCKSVSCPFSPNNTTPMNAPPLNQKDLFFSVLCDIPTPKSPNVIIAFKKCASLPPKVQTKNSQNQQFQTNQKMPKNKILAIFTWHRYCPPQSSENPILKIPNEVDNLLTVRWTSYSLSKG